MSDSLIEKMIEKGVNINNFQEVFNFFHSVDAMEDDLLNLITPYLVGIAQGIVNEATEGKADKVATDLALSQKLNRDEYNNHFRGLYKSYIALTEANIVAVDGDYAHIDGGISFGRMAAIWDSDDGKWVINEVQIALNTDEMPEGSNNLYFKQDRVKNTVLTGLVPQNPTEIMPTDNIITALAKLQAQLKVPPEVKWHKAEDVLIQKVVKTNLYATISGVRFDLEFAKINGMLWMRGAFEVLSSIQIGYTIWTLKPEWRVQSVRVGKVPNHTSPYNVYVPTSPTSENSLYVHSHAVVNSDITVEQDIRAFGTLTVNVWGVGGAVCLGSLIQP
ncbi:hypothetical protein [Acinetobacter sp. CFCC 10889]|uniref:hypothetical protein n=1 Tax=Acinetobacter sp. CFCC 10889 TaxID=1775557 RepID=UPI000DCF7366|nr:hypothetical protein [Acinetobacter sp. CFCC 10889]